MNRGDCVFLFACHLTCSSLDLTSNTAFKKCCEISRCTSNESEADSNRERRVRSLRASSLQRGWPLFDIFEHPTFSPINCGIFGSGFIRENEKEPKIQKWMRSSSNPRFLHLKPDVCRKVALLKLLTLIPWITRSASEMLVRGLMILLKSLSSRMVLWNCRDRKMVGS